MGKVRRQVKRWSWWGEFWLKRRAGQLTMSAILGTVLYFVLAPSAEAEFNAQSWLQAKWNHPLFELPNNRLTGIADAHDTQFMWNRYLKPILIPRPVGSENLRQVRKHITNSLTELNAGWTIELDQFREKPPAPYDEQEFTSIIATLNPKAPRKLVVACHYESKIIPGGEFVAATDSAVPCAMMLNAARELDSLLAVQKHQNPELTLQLVFLDGEEAFVDWTDKDSIYGARHLAQKWASTPFPTSTSEHNVLDSIDAFVLLDLLGAQGPRFESHFKETDTLHAQLTSIERRLHQNEMLSAHTKENEYFVSSKRYAGRISDDHLPFLHRGVRVVHWISTPFPRHWHKLSDDESNLHRPTVANLCKILNIFIAEYLHL